MLTTEEVLNNPGSKSCVEEKGMTSTKSVLDWKIMYFPDLREFACGCGAAVINISITYPINKLIFRQMLRGIRAQNAFSELHHEGAYYLYRGMLPPLLQKSLSLSIMFGVYDEVRKPLINTQINVYLARAIAGVAAGCVEAVFTPLERIQTLLQDSNYHQSFRNTFHAFRIIGTKYGFREYYRGLHTILLRNGPANACFFILREESQRFIPKTSSKVALNFYQFVCGAGIGVCVSAFFFPMNVAKVGLQSKIGGPFNTIFSVLPMIYRERGSKLRNVYRGVQVACARSFISWGIMNVAYENIKRVVY